MSFIDTVKWPEDFLAPGDHAVGLAYSGGMPDGKGGSQKVTSWITLFCPNWNAPDHTSVQLWVHSGSKHDPADPGAVNLIDYKTFDIPPGDQANYDIEVKNVPGLLMVQVVNNSPAKVKNPDGTDRDSKAVVAFNVHTQPA
jgi:hypothetical protein